MSKSGLKLNVFSGLASSFWSGAAAIVVVPFYLSVLGTANYGLVVFSTTLLGLFAVLDLGFATSINREVAQGGDPNDPAALRSLLHSLASIYWAIAAIAAAATFAAAAPIARTFLKSGSVDFATTIDAVRLMAALVVLRLPAGVYLGVLMGGQRIVQANLVTLGITTLSTFGTLAALRVTHGGILTFLAWQVTVSALNVLLLRRMAWKILSGEGGRRMSLRHLQRVWRFSSVIGLTTVVGALLLQLDKLVLARVAPLEIVGQYGLAGVASRALLLLVGPVFAALYPRLTELLARDNTDALVDLYNNATFAMTSVLAAATLFFSYNAPFILKVWTHSDAIAIDIRPVSIVLLIGTALNGIMYMPHAVQLAYGNARLAFWNNVAMMLFMAPAIVLLVPRYGMIGAANSWLGANIVNLLIGTWLTHRQLFDDSGLKWLIRAVLLPTLIVAVPFVIVRAVFPIPTDMPVLGIAVSGGLLGAGLIAALARLPGMRTMLRVGKADMALMTASVVPRDAAADIVP